jgi:hypothetical protein
MTFYSVRPQGRQLFRTAWAEYVAAVTQRNGSSCAVVTELPGDPVEAATKLIAQQPMCMDLGCRRRRILGLWGLCEAPAVAARGNDYCRRRHPSSVRESVLVDPNIDFGVAGEGEEAFAGVLNVLAGRRKREDVPGLLWRDAAGKAHANPCRVIEDLDQLPVPIRNAKILSACRVEGLIHPAPSAQHAVAQIMQSRGCTHACSFCASRLVFGNGSVSKSGTGCP